MTPSTDPKRASIEARVDEALEDSFPASDPPPWTAGEPAWAEPTARERDRESPARTDVATTIHRGHENVERLLLVLESHLARVSSDDQPDEDLMLGILRYVTDYVDRLYAPRERFAFGALLERVPWLAAVVERDAKDLEIVRQRGRALAALIERAVADEPVERSAIQREGFAFVSALRRRIVTEETVLLPAAEIALESSDWDEVEAALEQRGLRARADEEARYHAEFDELAREAGCGCTYVCSCGAASEPAHRHAEAR